MLSGKVRPLQEEFRMAQCTQFQTLPRLPLWLPNIPTSIALFPFLIKNAAGC